MRIHVLGNYMNAHFIHVDRLPVEGESLAARRVFQEHGGKGFNLGVGLHRLGAAVNMLLPVGNDAAGVAVTRILAEEGMDAAQVLSLGDASGFGVGFIAPDGSNFLAAHLGANAMLTPAHVDAACAGLGPGDWLLAHFELPFDTVRHALRLAHAAGVTTYLNPSPWRPIGSELLDLVDVLVVNETEAASLFGVLDMARAEPAVWAANLPSLAAAIGWRGRALVVSRWGRLAVWLSMPQGRSTRLPHPPSNKSMPRARATHSAAAWWRRCLAARRWPKPCTSAIGAGRTSPPAKASWHTCRASMNWRVNPA